LSNTCGRIDWGIPGPSSTISTHAHTPSFAFSRDTKTCTGTPDGERDEIDRLQLQVVETAVEASGVEQRRHERRELTHGVLDGTHLHDVVTAALGRGATCERVQAPRDRLQVIANVVRDDTDELLGHAAPRLLHGRPADRLDELRALGDARDPVRGAGDERRVERREEVGSPRRDEHHASPPLAIERHRDDRLHAKTFLDAAQLALVGEDVAAVIRRSRAEDFDAAPAIRQRQDVEAELALERRQRLRAGADGHERIARRIEDERVDLVGGEDVGERVGGLRERGLEVGCRHLQQALERVEVTLVVACPMRHLNLFVVETPDARVRWRFAAPPLSCYDNASRRRLPGLRCCSSHHERPGTTSNATITNVPGASRMIRRMQRSAGGARAGAHRHDA
jgi:hypothetical protein